jgi:hypothetical protein
MHPNLICSEGQGIEESSQKLYHRVRKLYKFGLRLLKTKDNVRC